MRLCSAIECLVMRPIVSRGQAIGFTDEWSFLRRPKLARVPEPIAGRTLWGKGIETVRTEHDPEPFHWFCFHTAKEILRARFPKKRNKESKEGGEGSHDADSSVEHRSLRCSDGPRHGRRGGALPSGRTSLSVCPPARHSDAAARHAR